MHVGQKLKELMKARGISTAEMAAHCGVSPGAVSNWFATGRITKENLAKAVARIGVTSDDVVLGAVAHEGADVVLIKPGGETVAVEAKGVRPMVDLAGVNFSIADVIETAPNLVFAEDAIVHKTRPPRPVWVIGKTQGGWPERVWDDAGFPVGGANEYAEVLSLDEHAFVVQVVGDSMAPKYMPGEYALVEPGTSADLEDDVLVRLSSGETMLKKLLSRRGGYRLGSYNSPEVLFFEPAAVSWMYYVPHPVPARKIKDWVETVSYQGPDRRTHYEPVSQDRRRGDDQYLGGMSNFGTLEEVPTKKTGGKA